MKIIQKVQNKNAISKKLKVLDDNCLIVKIFSFLLSLFQHFLLATVPTWW